MKKVLLVLLVSTGLLTGCGMTLIKHPDQAATNSLYAPESERQSDGIGIVEVSLNGADMLIEDRRKKAYRKMYEVCAGKYKILDKEKWRSSPSYTAIGNTLYSGSSKYEYIYFQCL